jgi:hypothetical protein
MTKAGVSYFGNRFPGHAHRDLVVISQCCDYVVHTLSEADLHYHKAALGRIFQESRKLGLEVWADPWGLGGVFGGEALSKFLTDHPEHWQRYSDGRPAPAACLNSRRFRDYVKEWVDTAASLGAQVIFWDEPHQAFTWTLEWEGVYSCTCPRCADLFAKKGGGAFPRLLTPEVLEFRRRMVTDFMGEMTDHARARGLRNALCLYAFEGYRPYEEIWNDLARLPALDVFGCDPYWRWNRGHKDPAQHVAHYARKLLDAVRPGQGTQIWVQAMRLPAGTEGEIGRAVRAAAEAGISHVAAWSFDGGALLDPVLAESPGAVWLETSQALAALRGKRPAP